ATFTASTVALGAGRVRAAHGDLPVPVRAVLELSRGRAACGGGKGELTTQTGMALLTVLCASQDDLPRLKVGAVGVGGTKDVQGRPNVTRVVLGRPPAEGAAGAEPFPEGEHDEVLLETNVDDLDPRVWPSVLRPVRDVLAAAERAAHEADLSIGKRLPLVHRPRAGCRQLGHHRLHRPAHGAGRRARAAGRPLHVGDPRP
ncbi:nickel insertion protein, partial [Segeticoccus rhizosphaerae]|uniref:nickel insertion protein n=1 Tax=Segeticoccus rhizosphaerae TaxID=1104777 RepID=UPI00193ADCB5